MYATCRFQGGQREKSNIPDTRAFEPVVRFAYAPNNNGI